METSKRFVGKTPITKRADLLFRHDNCLEAFLLQSCFVEGVIKILAHLYFKDTRPEDADRKPVSQILDSLSSMNGVDKELTQSLKEYIRLRNKVVHNILTYEQRESESMIKNMYTSGRSALFKLEGLIKKKFKKTIRQLEIDSQGIILAEDHKIDA